MSENATLSASAADGAGDTEYSSARKLVLRAAKREALLSGAGGGGKNKNDDSSTIGADFSNLQLKPDHIQRPCWVCPDGCIYLEAFHDLYVSAYDFLVAIAEPVARPEFIHQYKVTPYSLYAAVATNITTESIISVLQRLSKNAVPSSVMKFIRDCTSKYGKAKLVLKHNKFFVESEYPEVLRELLRDPTIAQARVVVQDDTDVVNPDVVVDEHGFITTKKAEEMKENLHVLREPDEDSEDEEASNQAVASSASSGANPANKKKSASSSSVVVSFQIKGDAVEQVKRVAIDLDYPLMEEYDFRNDNINPDVPNMDLKPHTRIRRYQERSLAKMFGNGRARSGIIVLPCGAGKTLTGVTAAQTIKKSVVCLCTNAVSVLQWKFQFQLWTNIPDEHIAVFTSDRKDNIHPDACVLVTTYTMIR
jgi:DNA excision repair protein ERCC-3